MIAAFTHRPDQPQSLTSSTSSLELPPARDFWPFQVTWSDTPAMSFETMTEFKQMARVAFGLNDPASLGWECQRLRADPPESTTVFRSEAAPTVADRNARNEWLERRVTDPFEVRF